MKTHYVSALTPEVGPEDHIRGRSDAPVTLVEYGDFQCPYCGMAYPMVKELEREAGTILRVIFRNFPLSQMHPHAQGAAEAAEAAAAQGKFWEMHDLLFENQQHLGRRLYDQLAESVGMDLAAFRDDLDQSRWTERVRGHFHSGVMSGVNGTPTFFINGQRYDGDYDLPSLLAAVRATAG